MSNKKQKKTQKFSDKENQKQNNRGKPCDIQNTKLNIPNIWTNDQTCLRLIKYLQDNGRHNCLHQAGKQSKQGKSDSDNKYNTNKSEIENTRQYYEKSEEFAYELFGHKCETKRCIVFFFRSNTDDKIIHPEFIRVNHQDCKDVLIKLSALFTRKFILDLVTILNQYNNIPHLVDTFISNGTTPQSFSPIIQNLFIKNMIETMKKQKSMQDFEQQNRADMEQVFYTFLQSSVVKEEVEKFIREIQLIFNRENDQYQPQDFENGIINDFEDNQDLFQNQQEEAEIQRESNSFFLSQEY